ncbi:MAG: transcription-repair coupling factor [Lachnospiraceae bacterium]|nr:transcription-repair coupling factor [Lachnospiraceae bacterium]
MLSCLKEPLSEYREYSQALEAIEKGMLPLRITGATPIQRLHFAQALSDNVSFRVIITYNDLQARKMAESYRLFDEDVLFYPAKDFIFYQSDIQGRQLVRERMKVIERLISGKGGTIITTIDAGMDERLPFKRFKDAVIKIDESSEIDLKKLEKQLGFMGYERAAKTESEGEFSIQGGIIDIYPMNAENPYRVELWGDEIDTIRSFDPVSQRSIEKVDGFSVYPACESLFTKEEIEGGLKKLKKEAKELSDKLRDEMKTEEAARLLRQVKELEENLSFAFYAVNLDSYILSFTKQTESLFDCFPEGTIYFMDEPARVTEHGEAVDLEYSESMKHRLEKGYVLPSQIKAVRSSKEVISVLAKKPLVLLSTLSGSTQIKEKAKFDLTVKSINTYRSDFALLTKDVASYKKLGYRTIIVTGSRTRGARLAKDLTDYDIPAFFTESKTRTAAPGEVMIVYGQLPGGFEYPLIKFVVISESDIFGTKKQIKKSDHTKDKKKLLDFNQLKPGDYVIHENHGLAIYRGLFEIESDHVKKDYIKLEYAGNGKLYIPVTNLDMLQKYSDGGNEDKKPKLASLNSQEWNKTKYRVKADINKIAEELVELYAKRQSFKGFAYSKDNVWQQEFEELFPYEETADQLRAIEDTKADMESDRIMDRLVCGDVGYGKTEIAIRAAFKAVQDSKQVAILVPTTILAQQHYNTLLQRLQNFPVTVDMLSRFRTKKEQSETLKKLKSGELDIVVGTHRLLSTDVVFKNLGLLIVDEEQRFGVTHKEKIKQLKTSVDVLTLSATPIPRTMHMSLVGIRDMSVLDEPPVDRMPIQTYVLEHNDELIREAISRELARGGQVYYVHNRITGIEDVAARLSAALPDANIAFAHGRMQERQLEKIMVSFIAGEIDVLISTTIIETGMDISNVNTMIIDDADRFGLAQLYQLRGRVGRSNRTAYAFLMYRKDKILREEAEKRLAAIREFTELGAGVKIAMRDLEIRGAGNLLGERQSGHMSIVGYDLYCKMLAEAVKKLKGEEVESDFETSVDMEVDAFIPANYISNEMVRLDIYKKIAQIENDEDLSDLTDELTDRYGDMPEEVNTLLYSSLIRALAKKVYVTDLKQRGSNLELVMFNEARLDVAKFAEFINYYRGACRLMPGTNPVFRFKIQTGDKKKLIKGIISILTKMQSLLMTQNLKEEKK